MATTFDPKELEAKAKVMHRSIAENPHGDFHFEKGRALGGRWPIPVNEGCLNSTGIARICAASAATRGRRSDR
jgi:hypothetical protein